MPPGKFFEILIATGAFWINLDHQLRAEFFSNIVYRSPATYFVLVIVNVMDFFCIDAEKVSPISVFFCSRSIRVPFHTQIAVIAIQSNAKLVRRTAPIIFLGHCPSLGKQTPELALENWQ